jgi:hypothetical protein
MAMVDHTEITVLFDVLFSTLVLKSAYNKDTSVFKIVFAPHIIHHL